MPDSPTPRLTEQSEPDRTVLLGNTLVRRIGYGAMQLARLRDDRAAANTILRRAVELGVDHIDTAQFYGDGIVNGFLRDALRPEDGVTVVTKVGFAPNPAGSFPMRPAQRPEELRASVEDNLRSLNLNQIPVVNLRRADGPHRVPMNPGQVVDFDDQLAAMVSMREEGLIGAIGLSSISLPILRRAVPAGIACVQNAYSLIARDDEDLLAACLEEQIAWVPYFPLGSAFPGMPKVTDEPVVRAVAESLGVTASQVGLAWLLQHASNTLLIPGTASVEHLEANMAAGSITLDDDMLAALDAIPARRPTTTGD